jgi:hypothetical protein
MQTKTRPVVKQVDHIAIRVDDPGYLFSLLADVFRLPVAWPLGSYGMVLSSGIFAGNVNLEVVRFGPPQASVAPEVGDARLYGIAFEPCSLSESLDELARRNVPHGPPIPYNGKRFDGREGTLYTTAVIDGLLDENPRTTFYLGKRLSGNTWVNVWLGRCLGKMIHSPLVAPLVLRSLGGSMVYLVEYTHDVEHARALSRAELAARRGGALGIEAVREIVAGVTDLAEASARWQRLLEPIRPTAVGFWELPAGPAIRLVPSPNNAVQAIVFKVTSLERARSCLAEQKMLEDACTQQVIVNPSRVQGLDIRLVA